MIGQAILIDIDNDDYTEEMTGMTMMRKIDKPSKLRPLNALNNCNWDSFAKAWAEISNKMRTSCRRLDSSFCVLRYVRSIIV